VKPLITQQKLIELKRQYWNLYYIEIEGMEFLFRELSRSEYKNILRTLGNVQEQEDYICKTCVIEPEDFDYENCPAGIPESLANFILLESGFKEDTGKLRSYLEHYRGEMDTFDSQMSCIIHEAFPEHDLEDIDGWPMEKAVYYYSRAEYILNSLRGIGLQYISQEEMQQSEQKPTKTAQTKKPEPAIQEPSKTEVQAELVGEHSEIADFPELAEIKKFMDGKLFK
jgi:hypothetical protein